MRAEAGVRPLRGDRRARDRRRGRVRAVRRGRRVLGAGAVLALLVLGSGALYAGSPSRIAGGVTVVGVDVGGLTVPEARKKLEALAARYASVPVVFTAGEGRFAISPDKLELEADWAAAAESALEAGDGPLPLRGLERLKVRLLGEEVAPAVGVYEPALRYRLNSMASAIDQPGREASIHLHGLSATIVASRPGATLERGAARSSVLAALAGFEREPVALPVVADDPEVTTAELAPVLRQVRTALSAPVRLTYKGGGWTVRPASLARLLVLPSHGRTALRVGGPAATAYFENLAAGVHRRPVSADFLVRDDGSVQVVPARPGRQLDVTATEEGVLAAAVRPERRTAPLVIAPVRPPLTTARARSLHIERQLASYSTLYSGTADRTQNLQRAVSLLDGALVASGAEFSFNRRVGPRTTERGFRSAPVIMNGQYEEGIGGGTSQVATTLFNAAWEAGLRITARTAHALYISRYPTGRDATVNYPDVDLRFRNDTSGWIVVAASFDESGIAIRLLGSGPERRVVSEAGPLEETTKPPVERTPDPDLLVGERVVEDDGEPGREVRVTRTVYERGKVLYDDTWYTSYRGEPKLVRYGTKPAAVEEAPPPEQDKKKNKKDGETPATPSG